MLPTFIRWRSTKRRITFGSSGPTRKATSFRSSRSSRKRRRVLGLGDHGSPRLPGSAPLIPKVDRHRLADQVPLGNVAARLPEPIQLLDAFDAFRDNVSAQTMPECDNRAHDGRVVAVERYALDERPIDLDRIDW